VDRVGRLQIRNCEPSCGVEVTARSDASQTPPGVSREGVLGEAQCGEVAPSGLRKPSLSFRCIAVQVECGQRKRAEPLRGREVWHVRLSLLSPTLIGVDAHHEPVEACSRLGSGEEMVHQTSAHANERMSGELCSGRLPRAPARRVRAVQSCDAWQQVTAVFLRENGWLARFQVADSRAAQIGHVAEEEAHSGKLRLAKSLVK